MYWKTTKGDVLLNTWDNIMSRWEYVLPPSRPSSQELDRIKSCLIHYNKDEPVGVLGICKSREEKYSDSGELGCLYLLNKVKKLGFGRILFEKGIEELKKQGFNSMIIYCLKDNPTTRFYEYMGGKLVLSKERKIGGKDLIENVYYYDSI